MRGPSDSRTIAGLARAGAVAMLAAAVVGLTGCDTGQGRVRRPLFRPTPGGVGAPSPASGGGYDLEAIRDGSKLELPDDDPGSVLKSRGGSGAWSSEARAIEKSLGVGP